MRSCVVVLIDVAGMLMATVACADQWTAPGDVRGLAVGPTGTVYALGADSVWKFTPSGERITAWANVAGAFIAASFADDVYVTDGGTAITRTNSVGVPLASWPYTSGASVRGMATMGGKVLVQSRINVFVFAPDGTELAVHATRNGAGIAASGERFFEIIGSDGGLLVERDANGDRVWTYEYPRDDSPDRLPLYVPKYIATGAAGEFVVAYNAPMLTPWSNEPSLEWWEDGEPVARILSIPTPNAIACASDGTVYVASGSSVHVYPRDEATARIPVSLGQIKARWR